MVDTPRSVAELIVLFADNVIGNISEQDNRDLIETLNVPRGRASLSASAATTISVGVFTKALGTTTTSGAAFQSMDTDSANNRLRYTGSPTTYMNIRGQLSLSGTTNNTVSAKIFFFDDSASSGSVLDDTLVTTRCTTGSVPFALTVDADILMDTNDYVEIWITNETGSNAVTAENLRLQASGAVT